VYPPTYSSYIGIARNLFRLFPKIWDSPVIQSVYSRAASIEKLLYPRSVKALTRRQLEALEKELIDNPISMLELEVGFAGLITTVLKDYFGLQPQSCSGYSVGEISMMVSQGIWSSFNQTSSGLNSSELFTNRLSGAKNAVREYWGLENTEIHKELWGNYVLMAEVFQVREQLKNEPRVYLTQINTSKEVVIAGEPQACQRVIAAIGCNAIPAPFNYLIHCEAMASEYDEFVRLHTLPINKKPEIDFYSSAEYKIVQQDRDMVAHAIAKNVCQQLDFPKLVNQLYADGARIFVEAGAGNSCSRWIKENLKDKEHTTIFLNRKGIAEHTSLLRGLGQLLSHRVSFDLSPLYKSNLPVENSSLDLQSFTERNVWEELEPALPKFQPKPVNSYDSKKQTSSDNIQPMVTLSPYYWNKFSMEELRINATYQTRILHS
ncbi:MAG: polyketide synthase, partial [Cyanobacteria bacterium J06649_11]